MKRHVMMPLVAGALLLVQQAVALEPGTASFLFQGSSTLHDFEGTAPGRFVVSELTEVEPGRTSCRVRARVSVLDMVTGNEKRDANMYRMFDAGQWPEVSGWVELPFPVEPGIPGRVLMTIRGADVEVPCEILDVRKEDGLLSVTVGFDVSLADAGLKAPSVLGLIRVGDRVHVQGTFSVLADAGRSE